MDAELPFKRTTIGAVELGGWDTNRSELSLTSVSLRATEVLRVLDCTLAKTRCPICEEESLVGFEESTFKCEGCRVEANIEYWDLERAIRRNVVAHPKGNVRRHVGKAAVRALFKMQEGYCAYCTNALDTNYHVEHIVPISFGGTNRLSNLALSCKRCNLLAGAKVFPSITAKRFYILSQISRSTCTT